MKNILTQVTTAISNNSDNITALKKQFPQCFDKHGAFILEKFNTLMHSDTAGFALSQEGYSLNWLGKSYARVLANEPVRTFLSADTIHNQLPANIHSKNILIKGDNLEVLKHLKGAYSEAVKMIYIDPPYNTGSDGFVYNDDRQFTIPQLCQLAGITEVEAKRILEFTNNKSNSHSAWLTFIYPRLYIARQLLRDDGVIFISIDDNEQAQLKILCDEVFGEENSFINSIWCKGNAQNDAEYIQKNHEYILGYKKNNTSLIEKKTSIKKVLSEGDKYFYLGSGIVTGGAGGTLKNRLNLGYSIYINPHTKDFIACDDYDKELAKISDDEFEVYKDNQDLIKQGYVNIIRPPKKGKSLGCWTWNIEKFNDEKDTIFITDNNSIYKKIFVEKDKIKNNTIEIIEDSPPNSVISFSSSESSKWLNKELGHKVFDNPKPFSLIKRFLNISTNNKTDIILDFFAGSGTTAHAVMELNAEDNGNRQFICVQIDEKTSPDSEAYKAGYTSIFDITHERIKRAATAIKNNSPLFSGDLGFKQFETVPVFDGYLDEAEELTENLILFDGSSLSTQERQILLQTWAIHDGLPLHEVLIPIDLAGYTAYQTSDILYFIEPKLNIDTVICLLEKIDTTKFDNKDSTFAPRRLVLWPYGLDSKILREFSEAIKCFNNRKSIVLTLDIRY